MRYMFFQKNGYPACEQTKQFLLCILWKRDGEKHVFVQADGWTQKAIIQISKNLNGRETHALFRFWIPILSNRAHYTK